MKYYTWIGIVLAVLFLTMFSQGVQDAVILFVIAGIIPGTSISIPPLVMLALAATAMVLVLRIGHHETRKISLPPLEQTAKKPRGKRRTTNRAKRT